MVLVESAVEIILFTHGEMLVFSCNWANRLTTLQKCSKDSAKYIFRVVTSTAVLLGLFTYLNTGLYVHFDMDPWYILKECLNYYLPHHFKPLSYYQYLFWKLVRYVFFFMGRLWIINRSYNSYNSFNVAVLASLCSDQKLGEVYWSKFKIN